MRHYAADQRALLSGATTQSANRSAYRVFVLATPQHEQPIMSSSINNNNNNSVLLAMRASWPRYAPLSSWYQVCSLIPGLFS